MQVRLLRWSLRHRTGRHVVNGLAMAVTAAVVIVFVAVMGDMIAFTRTATKNGLARMILSPRIVMPGSGTDGIPESLYSTLTNIPGIKTVERKLVLIGRHPSGPVYIVAGEEETGVDLNPDLYPAAPDVVEAWKKERPTGAIVSEQTAADLHLSVGQTTEIPTVVGPIQIKIVGIDHGGLFKTHIVVHFEYLEEAAGHKGMIGFRVFTAPSDAESVAREITAKTRNSSVPVQVLSDAHILSSLVRRSATVPAVLGFLGLFLIFTTALTLANNNAISIRERRIEVATLRVLGFYPRTILAVLVAETALVGVIGGCVAVVATAVGFHGGVHLMAQFPPVTIKPMAMAAGVVASIVVPLAGALPTALAAVKAPLSQGLRDAA